MENGNGKRVVVAMSGGVDSSVTAGLLVEAGYEVIGMTMQLYDRKDMATPVKGSCCSLDDVFDARRVAEQLGIPFYVLNFQEAFKKIVVENLTGEYLSGRTPNPCIRCNDFMKFRLLLKRAMSLGAEFMATGHYAQIIEDEGTWRLRKAVDPDKDQTYFLYGMNQDQMSKVRFPLGGMTKAEVREHARRLGISPRRNRKARMCVSLREKNTLTLSKGRSRNYQVPGRLWIRMARSLERIRDRIVTPLDNEKVWHCLARKRDTWSRSNPMKIPW